MSYFFRQICAPQPNQTMVFFLLVLVFETCFQLLEIRMR